MINGICLDGCRGIRRQPSNVDSVSNSSYLKVDGIVLIYLKNAEWTFVWSLKLVFCSTADQNKVVLFVEESCVSSIISVVVFINVALFLPDIFPVDNMLYAEYHVTN